MDNNNAPDGGVFCWWVQGCCHSHAVRLGCAEAGVQRGAKSLRLYNTRSDTKEYFLGTGVGGFASSRFVAITAWFTLSLPKCTFRRVWCKLYAQGVWYTVPHGLSK